MKTSSTLPTMGSIQNDKVMPYHFQITDVLNEAWQRVSGAKAAIWGSFFTYIILYVGLGSIMLAFTPSHTERFSQIISSIMWLLLFPLSIGIGYLAIRRSVDLPIQVKQIFGMYASYWKLLGTMLLMFILIGLVVFFSLTITGFLMGLLVISHPASILIILLAVFFGVVIFYITLSLSFAPFLVVEKHFGIIQSLKVSFTGFSQHGFKMMLLYFIMWIICFFSAIPFCIGLIWTFPMYMNVIGIMYRTLFGISTDTTLK